ncbi:hypothetical protein JCM10207_006858 [Rhodosporidiobolus poonsookiae]
MDVDQPPQQQRPQRRVSLAPESTYDLDHISQQWDTIGRTKVTRLLFVASTSPSVAGHALTLALDAIKHLTLDVNLYNDTFHRYRQHISALEANEEADPTARQWLAQLKAGEVTEHKLDREWIEQARKEAQSGLDRLEVELKGYMTNLIKESIRMGHRDLARFQYRTGDLQGAVRSYTKSREFCTTGQHVLEMCLGVIEVALDMSNYAFVRNYVVKAESALESASSSAQGGVLKKPSAPVNLPGMVAPAQDPAEAARERDKRIVLERLTVAGGVAHLGAGQFEKAAWAFTEVGSEAIVSGPGHFIPTADLALYATLTSLACFPRAQVRARVLDNAGLRPALDQEPWLRELARAFYDSRFREGLGMLQRHEARFLLDPHLAPHFPTLSHLLLTRSLTTFFTPFSSVSLSSFSSAFGLPPAQVGALVADLIGRGELAARIDQVGGVVVARRDDPRAGAFRRALEMGEGAQKRAKAGRLRMKLLQSDLIVKGSTKGGGGGGKTVVGAGSSGSGGLGGEAVLVDA